VAGISAVMGLASDGAIDLTIDGGNTGIYTYVWTTADGSIPAGQENITRSKWFDSRDV
jgi:hypothetical protein